MDLYSAADKRAEIRIEDGTHYNEEGYKLLGNAVADAILNQ